MSSGDQIAVPAEHRVRSHQQPQPVQDIAREPMDERRDEGPVTGVEPYLLMSQSAFQHGDLMAEHQDLDLFVLISHRQEPQHRERVGDTQVSQSKQHGRSSCQLRPYRQETQTRSRPSP